MWGDGPKDMSHIYMGMALGAGRRANQAEDTIEKLDRWLGAAHGEKIAWRAIANAFQLLCEAMVEELGNPAKLKELSDPFNAELRIRFLEHAVQNDLNEATTRNEDNGNATTWPNLLPTARENVSDLLREERGRMNDRCLEHLIARKRRESAG